MTDDDKKRIAEYMGWTTEPYWWCEKCKEEKSPYHVTYNTNCSDCGCAVVIKEDHPFDSNNASLCVQEMQKRGDLEYFVGDTEDTLIYNIRYHKEHHSYKSFLVAWLFNSENFFAAMSEWLKRKGNEIQMANEE